MALSNEQIKEIYGVDDLTALPLIDYVSSDPAVVHAMEEYDELIKIVKTIDLASAAYLVHEALYLDSFSWCGSISKAFLWEETDIEEKHWYDLHVEVLNRKRESKEAKK